LFPVATRQTFAIGVAQFAFSKRLVKLFWLSMAASKAAKGKNQATAQPQLGSELCFRMQHLIPLPSKSVSFNCDSF
jgi:hypothetical protein